MQRRTVGPFIPVSHNKFCPFARYISGSGFGFGFCMEQNRFGLNEAVLVFVLVAIKKNLVVPIYYHCVL